MSDTESEFSDIDDQSDRDDQSETIEPFDNARYCARNSYIKKDGTRSQYLQKYYVKGGPLGRRTISITKVRNLNKDFTNNQKDLLLRCAENMNYLEKAVSIMQTLKEKKGKPEFIIQVTEALECFKCLNLSV